ncbi:MAG: phospholipid/cholesterol/gamma-HCH transport system substrate-binding protein [Pseudonocardiales bacterium]|jgi:virulence factor Mce-like protein|nr:phospholipid/cholesterol/gamma-HCH transport system substrate-binding protein [Pseudonocardiales bacterium]
MARESFGTIARRRLLGLTFLVVLAGLVALSVAVYNKAFTPVVTVHLKTDHTGNQLLEGSDVKARGVIVGSVKKVKSTGDGATVTLAIEPGRRKLIPADVQAQILPKTLFGEQFVALIIRQGDDSGAIQAGATIAQDRSSVALETERVLGDLLPLIQAVQPAELNATLTAMATALKGRGAELGYTLTHMDSYLKSFNPSVKQLVDDLKQLGQFSDQLNAAAPDLLATLDNFETGARTVIQKQSALDSILTQADTTSNLLTSFLSENASRLITIVDTTDSIYTLLNQYTPEYGCMLHGLAKYFDRANLGIVHHQIQLSAQLYIAQSNYGAYHPGNEPVYITGVGPVCFGIPNPPVPFVVPSKYRCLNDGANLTADNCAAKNAVNGRDQQAIGSAAENAEVNSLLASAFDTTPNKVPGVATLLLAPSLRGQVVTVK